MRISSHWLIDNPPRNQFLSHTRKSLQVPPEKVEQLNLLNTQIKNGETTSCNRLQLKRRVVEAVQRAPTLFNKGANYRRSVRLARYEFQVSRKCNNFLILFFSFRKLRHYTQCMLIKRRKIAAQEGRRPDQQCTKGGPRIFSRFLADSQFPPRIARK